jgi:predicted amino acid dehydrogenase
VDTFAFIIHPIDPKRDVSRKYPFLGRHLTERQIDFFSTFFPPVYISEINGITSRATGKEVQGWFVACPYTPRRMLELPERAVYRKIIQTGHLAEKLGAQILGLGAFTSVVGDAGVTIARALDELRSRLAVRARAGLRTSISMDALSDVQLILTVTSAVHDVIRPEHLRPGSVICDVARPRDVSAMVAAVRDDILVIDGGMVEIPGPVDFHFNFGFPPGNAYACMAETMALSLEGRFEDYTLGKHITRQRVEEITAIAEKHGFRLSGFRSFEREVTAAQIESIRQRAQQARRRN